MLKRQTSFSRKCAVTSKNVILFKKSNLKSRCGYVVISTSCKTKYVKFCVHTFKGFWVIATMREGQTLVLAPNGARTVYIRIRVNMGCCFIFVCFDLIMLVVVHSFRGRLFDVWNIYFWWSLFLNGEETGVNEFYYWRKSVVSKISTTLFFRILICKHCSR